MTRRTRAVKGLISGLIAAAVILLFLSILAYIVMVSLQANASDLQHYVHDPIVSGLIVLLTLPTFVFLFSLVSGFRIPWASLTDHRRVFRRSELDQHFEKADATAALLVEDGFSLKSDGHVRLSRLVYRNEVTERFTFFAVFRPIRKGSRGAYWRAGLFLRRATGTLADNEVICVHLDNQNLLIGYLNRQPVLSAAIPSQVHDKWSRLGITVGISLTSPTTASIRIYAHLDDFSYYLGEVPQLSAPLKASIEAWSDDHRDHHVLVRDISFTSLQA